MTICAVVTGRRMSLATSSLGSQLQERQRSDWTNAEQLSQAVKAAVSVKDRVNVAEKIAPTPKIVRSADMELEPRMQALRRRKMMRKNRLSHSPEPLAELSPPSLQRDVHRRSLVDLLLAASLQQREP